MEKIYRIIDIIRQGADYLTKFNIESARLNIELILCNVLKLDRVQLYTLFDKPINEGELSEIRECLRRRVKREPLQYIFEHHKFIDIDIKIDSSVLVPRPETELLAEEARLLVQKEFSNGCEILDIGTGSGCIAIYLAKHCPNAHVTAIDISNEAINKAKENAMLNNINNIDFYVSDILKVTPKKKYNIIISNPPYISLSDYNNLEAELSFEPKIALSDNLDGYKYYRRFNEFFYDTLAENSFFLLEIGAGQHNEIKNMFNSKFSNINVLDDLSGIPRMVIGKKQ